MAHNEMHKSGRKGPEINVIGIVKMMKLKILSLKDNSHTYQSSSVLFLNLLI